MPPLLLWGMIMKSMREQLWGQLYIQVRDQVSDQTSDQVKDQAFVIQRWGDKSVNLIWGRVWSELYNQIMSDDK